MQRSIILFLQCGPGGPAQAACYTHHMGVLTATGVSVEEYLSNPAYEHCEYIDGQPVEINLGHKKHGRIQLRCGRRLDEYFDSRPGYVGTEIHCRLRIKRKTLVPTEQFLIFPWMVPWIFPMPIPWPP